MSGPWWRFCLPIGRGSDEGLLPLPPTSSSGLRGSVDASRDAKDLCAELEALRVSGRTSELVEQLSDVGKLQQIVAGSEHAKLVEVVQEAMSACAGDEVSAERLQSIASFLGRHALTFSDLPGPNFVLQQAANECGDELPLAKGARARLDGSRLPYLRLANKPRGRDPALFSAPLKYGDCIAHGSVDVWRHSHVVVASHELSSVRCYDLRSGRQRWSAVLATPPKGPVRVSNDGTRVAVALDAFPSLAVLRLADGSLLGTMADEAKAFHEESGYNDRLELICWTADSRALVTAAHGDCLVAREAVLWDAVNFKPLRVVARAAADGGTMWAMRPHSRFGSHGRTSFGFGLVDADLVTGDEGRFVYDAAADRVMQGAGADREYEGERFDRELAASHCGRYRVVSRRFGAGLELLFAAAHDEGRILCYLGTTSTLSDSIACEPCGPSLRVAALAAGRAASPVLFNVPLSGPAGEALKPSAEHGGLGDGEAAAAAWRFALQHGRTSPAPAGALLGHAADVVAARFVEGGARLATYDREALRVWDLSGLDAAEHARAEAAGDAERQPAPAAADALAAAPLLAGALVASLREDGRLSLLRCGPGPARALVVPLLGHGTREAHAAALAAASKGPFAAALAASSHGRLRLVRASVSGDGGLEAGAPAELRLRLPCALTAAALSPGVGPSASDAHHLELYVGLEDGGVHAFALRFGDSVRLEGRRASWFHGGPVAALAVSHPDPEAAGRARQAHVASLAWDGTVALAALEAYPSARPPLLHLVDRVKLSPLLEAPSRVAVADAEPDSTPAVACSAGSEVYLYRKVIMGDGFDRRTLRGHAARVAALAFSRRRLVSISADGGVRVWDASTGRAVHRLGLWAPAPAAVALCGASYFGAFSVPAGAGGGRLDVFELAHAASEGDGSGIATRAEPTGGRELAAGLTLRALADGFAERFSVAAAGVDAVEQATCWLEKWREFGQLPAARYQAFFEVDIGGEASIGALHFRVRGRNVAASDAREHAPPTDYGAPEEYNRAYEESEQAEVRGKHWTDVRLKPFRVLRSGGPVRIGVCHSGSEWKDGYRFGPARVRPILPHAAESNGAEPLGRTRSSGGGNPDAPAAHPEWTVLHIVPAAGGGPAAEGSGGGGAHHA